MSYKFTGNTGSLRKPKYPSTSKIIISIPEAEELKASFKFLKAIARGGGSMEEQEIDSTGFKIGKNLLYCYSNNYLYKIIIIIIIIKAERELL